MVTTITPMSTWLTGPTRAWRGLALCVALLGAPPVPGGRSLFGRRFRHPLGQHAALQRGIADRSTRSEILWNPNGDDGDRDFAPGLISNRLDLLSALDISQGEFGAHVSVAAWYDMVYLAHTDNNSPATYNPASVPNISFARAVRDLHGRYAEIDDAFVYGNFSAADTPVSVRLGRQTLLWGESLFFDENDIAAAQAPVDYIRSLSEPEGYSKDVFLPVNQLSATLQPGPGLAIALYYQFDGANRVCPASAAISATATFWGRAPSACCCRGGNICGTAGISHRLPADNSAPRFMPRSTISISVSTHSATAINIPSCGFNPLLAVFRRTNWGQFAFVYPGNIELYGASFSTYVGDSNVAGEFALRRHAPIIDTSMAMPLYPQNSYDRYGRGDTLHGQVSGTTTLAPAGAWDSADLSVEIAANYLLGVEQSGRGFDPDGNRLAMDVRALVEPHYFEVLPGLDITVPVGLGYNIAGRSSIDYARKSGAGDVEVGMSASYRSIWKASLSMKSFLGTPSNQPLADRDFLSVSIERTF